MSILLVSHFIRLLEFKASLNGANYQVTNNSANFYQLFIQKPINNNKLLLNVDLKTIPQKDPSQIKYFGCLKFDKIWMKTIDDNCKFFMVQILDHHELFLKSQIHICQQLIEILKDR